MDFLSSNLPMCVLHQSRSIILFCYIFAILIEFLLYPPYSIGNSPFSTSTLFVPPIIVLVLHLFLTICYAFGAFFERATCKTGLALFFLLHAPVALVALIGCIVLLNQDDPDFYTGFSITFAVGFFIDFICGVISRPSQRISLSLELLAFVPGFILLALYFKGTITNILYPFLPPFIYFVLYFILLIFLTPICNPCHGFALSFFANPELNAEFAASVDPQLKPFKNRADWDDEADGMGSDHGARHEAHSRWAKHQNSEAVTRFPSRSHFQLYNIDAVPENPLYLASPLPMFCFAILLILVYVQCVNPLANFYYWLAAVIALLVLAVMLNSRALACGCLSFTNLDERCVEVLWDHPSLAIL